MTISEIEKVLDGKIKPRAGGGFKLHNRDFIEYHWNVLGEYRGRFGGADFIAANDDEKRNYSFDPKEIDQ